MTLYRTTLDKEVLLGIPEEERRLFLGLAHITNEIRGFQKLLLWSSDFQEEDPVLARGRITFSLQFLRILAGKLNEAYEVVTRYFLKSRTGRTFQDRLTEEGKDARSRN